MCLILLAVDQHPDYPLVFAANRDEFYERPTTPAHFWDDAPHVLAGRDEEAGGTWCGVTGDGRIAAVTNFREPPEEDDGVRSRGELVADFLRGGMSPQDYLRSVDHRADEYRGFNLLVGDADSIHYYSNRHSGVTRLGPGLYGLSNHLLDTPWFKIRRSRTALARVLGRDRLYVSDLFAILEDEERAPDDDLPLTGFGRQWERILSPVFIRSEHYGTRSSTVILFHADGTVEFAERVHTPETRAASEQVFTLPADAPAAHRG